MKESFPYPAIYDFALFPYALGDSLTWNVQTSIRAIQLGCTSVDIHICLDRERPASIYQQGLIHEGNYHLHFHELFPAFHTHPMVRHLKIFADRESMLRDIEAYEGTSPEIREDIDMYRTAIADGVSEEDLNTYFLKFIYSHRQLNDWAADNGSIPLLIPPSGCVGDVQYLSRTLLRNRRPVVVHFRLRRLDLGMAGEHTYARDADFVEWYEFLVKAAKQHPEVHFVVVGRLPEKPLSILRLPNVSSLRTLGMNLGHELALLARADLFMGSSSGFAAMANFTSVPYFITKMGESPCKAYEIPIGAERLPFGLPGQKLVYEDESEELLTRLLSEGLERPSRQEVEDLESCFEQTPVVDHALGDEHANLGLEGSSTHRFYLDDAQCDAEILHLIQRNLDDVGREIDKGNFDEANSMLDRLEAIFPRAVFRSSRLRALRAIIAEETGRPDHADIHRAWSVILEARSDSPDSDSPTAPRVPVPSRPSIPVRIFRNLKRPRQWPALARRIIRRIRKRPIERQLSQQGRPVGRLSRTDGGLILDGEIFPIADGIGGSLETINPNGDQMISLSGWAIDHCSDGDSKRVAKVVTVLGDAVREVCQTNKPRADIEKGFGSNVSPAGFNMVVSLNSDRVDDTPLQLFALTGGGVARPISCQLSSDAVPLVEMPFPGEIALVKFPAE